MTLELEEIGEASIHPVNSGWRMSVTKSVRERLGIRENKPHRVVVWGIKGVEGIALLVDKRRVPKKKDYLESALGMPLEALEFSLPKQIYDRLMKQR